MIVGCGILNSIVSPHRETLITILNLAQFMLGYLSLTNSELRPVFLERRSQKGVSITAKDKCISAFMEGFVFIILSNITYKKNSCLFFSNNSKLLSRKCYFRIGFKPIKLVLSEIF